MYASHCVSSDELPEDDAGWYTCRPYVWTSDVSMLRAVAMSDGKVLNNCEVASEELTTKSHGYSVPSRRIEMSVSSLIGSEEEPVPDSGLLTTELAGTIRVGMLLGIVAVAGRSVELGEPLR
jgi:hypothetical protein